MSRQGWSGETWDTAALLSGAAKTTKHRHCKVCELGGGVFRIQRVAPIVSNKRGEAENRTQE